MNQKGFSNAIIAVLVVVIAGVVGSFVLRELAPVTSTSLNNSTTSPTPKPTSPPPAFQNNSLKIIKGHSSAGKSIKVTLVHDTSSPHSLNDNFIVTNNTHIFVSLYDASLQDVPVKMIVSQNFTDIKKLPFLFEITGDLDKILKERNDYYISATVLGHSGNKLVVGDLYSENAIPVTADDNNIEIRVLGMEDCDSPNAGGFCV